MVAPEGVLPRRRLSTSMRTTGGLVDGGRRGRSAVRSDLVAIALTAVWLLHLAPLPTLTLM